MTGLREEYQTGSSRWFGFPHIPLSAVTAGLLSLLLLAGTGGCSGGSSNGSAVVVPAGTTVVVNSLDDSDSPPAGVVTLRSAVARVVPGGTITFDPALNGGTINLSIVGTTNSLLKGEVFTFNPVERKWVFEGYQDRDYGRSALYARKDLAIDASSLPAGITLKWAGGDTNRARVLAVYGNLTMKKVTVTGGFAGNEALAVASQPYSLARGGGLAVWGTATLEQCTFAGNRASGDENPSRDRGAFGGGIYAERVVLSDCTIGGNSASGFGAAGGGVYSVGGVEAASSGSTLTRCSVSGNRVTGQHAYGGGVYSDGGGPGNMKALIVSNCTVARNLVGDHPGIAENAMYQYYYRGGGLYMSNGSLIMYSSTVAENAVNGTPAMFSGKPNMGGGGIAATIGDAHVVEYMQVWHTIIAGNSLNGSADDLYTGSLLHFYSNGYNLIGRLDFSQMLVPIPDYMCLSRKHWPKAGDRSDVAPGDVLAAPGPDSYHPSIISVGSDAGRPLLRWYRPAGPALDSIPATAYPVESVLAGYSVVPGGTDDFLNRIRDKVRADYATLPGTGFGTLVGDMSGVVWYGPFSSWPSNPANGPWIGFWKNLDRELGTGLDPVKLGDDFWGTFTSGPWGDIMISVEKYSSPTGLTGSDQLGRPRPSGLKGDIGAIES